MAPTTMTKKERAVLHAVIRGGDVYDWGAAQLLRALAARGFVAIVPAQGAPENGAMRQPYFGAILTAKGQRALKGAKRRNHSTTPKDGG